MDVGCSRIQIVQVYIYLSRGFGSDIYGFVVDHLACDDRTSIMGETPKMLIPVGPGVVAAAVSTPLPHVKERFS